MAPLNETARKYSLTNIVGVAPDGSYMISSDYVEDTVNQLLSEGFVVEVK